MEINNLLKLDFQTNFYKNLQRKIDMFLNVETFIDNEYHEEKINVSYYQRKLTDKDTGIVFSNIEEVIDFYDIKTNKFNHDFIYFIKKGKKFKIGKTQNLLRRINELQQINFEEFEYFTYFLCEDVDYHEKILKNIFTLNLDRGEKFFYEDSCLNFFLHYAKNIIKDSDKGLTLFV